MTSSWVPSTEISAEVAESAEQDQTLRRINDGRNQKSKY